MSILHLLASSFHQRDETPNIELAKQIAAKNDRKAIKELIENLDHKSAAIQSDCIKVLYETGERNPSLIAPHINIFIGLLNNKNNRLQWGAMTALDAITFEKADAIYSALPKIVDAAGQGSVITRDHAVEILIKLCTLENYSAAAFSLLLEQLQLAPVNQLPMYAEKTLAIINANNKKALMDLLSARLGEVGKESKRKRVEKVIKKLST